MIPVVTPEEMSEIDRAAPESTDILVARAGAAVVRESTAMLGGAYGRRVVVVAGKGNNGADGRAAAAGLRRRGVRVLVIDAADAPVRLPACDLVIDAAYGTGFRGEYVAPDPGGAPVLAVDIPSGVDGSTGGSGDAAVWAARTVTFAALKPGLVLHPGVDRAGEVSLADIGLDTSGRRTHLVEAHDVSGWLPERPSETHKWKTAVWVVAGSPGMTGAAHLCSRSAMRAGAGTVRLGIPGSGPDPGAVEVVGRPLPPDDWDSAVVEDSARARAMVVGPGLARTDSTRRSLRRLLAASSLPAIVDADGLYALGDRPEAAEVLRDRQAPTVLTPHEGEFARLNGAAPGAHRLDEVRDLAVGLGATVLLKGSTTIIADPTGEVLITNTGGSFLATAGTGDVLAGVVGALLAQGLDGLRAAAAAAFVHGCAGRLGWRRGLVAGDLVDLLPAAIARLS